MSSKQTVNNRTETVPRSNAPEQKNPPLGYVILRWIVVAIQGWFTLLGAYFVQNQLDTILLELRSRLWLQDDEVYFDKWDFVHWGTAVVSVAMWPNRKIQRTVFRLGLVVILGFEVIEQILVCKGMTHAGSCEPWQDTLKDCFTGVFGICVGFYLPQLVQGLSPPETVSWTFSTVLFLPPWWWFGIPVKVLECIASVKYRNNPMALRVFFIALISVLLSIRYILGTLSTDLVIESIWVALGLQVVMRTVMWLDSQSRKLVE
eukprot:TRINITY_DN2046_c0_g1_i1.p1 TRINITY_DN2046_c0_g1~~TRINITY_DN2046_c0_g1_i1.p1  ORF type:complete len:277 (-),score=17.11 TRINITY_DN2046_c0_g1_i1:30-812(-)